MRVAESTEILRPMTQFGCAQAASGVTASRSSAAVSRNGPPEAVSRMRLRPAGRTPARFPGGRHWKMALCSRVDGQERRAGGVHRGDQQRACHDEGFLVRQQQALAGLRRSQRRAQAGSTDDRRHDTVHLARPGRSPRVPRARRARACRAPCPQQRGQFRGRRFIGEGSVRRAKREHLPRQLGGVAVCSEGGNLEALRMAREHIEGALAHRAGGSQDRDAHHGTTPIEVSPKNSTGAAAVMLSMRSIMPP